MSQDFTKRLSIVVRGDLPTWQALNAVAHISAYVGNKIGSSFGTEEYFVTQDNVNHPRNSQYPFIVLKASSDQMRGFIDDVRKSELLYLGFIREMIETTDDAEIEKILAKKIDADIEYLGIGVFGTHEEVKTLTKKFSLWK